jgi:hypothetical protein
MKKLLFLIVVACLTVPQINAQDDLLETGDKVLNLGIGLSGYYGGRMVTPPLSASFEVGVVDQLINGKGSVGVGGYLGFSSYRYNYIFDDYTITNLILGARGAFHYPFVENLDTYAGLILGYNFNSGDEFKVHNYGFTSAEFVGARYYFSESFAAMAELGVGSIFNINLGIALKF